LPQNAKPRALKLIEGRRGHRKRNDAEPLPAPRLPGKPEELTPEASALWDQMAPDLIRYGLLTEWDGPAFAAFCEAVIAHRKSVALIRVGLLVKGKDQPLVVNPGWRVFRDSTTLVCRLGAQFGLTPASRSTLRANINGLDEDAEEALFSPVR